MLIKFSKLFRHVINELQDRILAPIHRAIFLFQNPTIFPNQISRGKSDWQNFRVQRTFGNIDRNSIIIFFQEFFHIFLLVLHRNQCKFHFIFFQVIQFLNGRPFRSARRTPRSPKIKEQHLSTQVFQIRTARVDALQIDIQNLVRKQSLIIDFRNRRTHRHLFRHKIPKWLDGHKSQQYNQ